MENQRTSQKHREQSQEITKTHRKSKTILGKRRKSKETKQNAIDNPRIALNSGGSIVV